MDLGAQQTLIPLSSLHFSLTNLPALFHPTTEMPPPGAYKALSSFEMENRTALPKTNYYTFDKSATRDQMNKTFNPLDNSPRGVESKQIPGPGHYMYKNMTVGTGGRHFSFL